MNQSPEVYPASNMNLDFQHDESILSTHKLMMESTDLEAHDESTLISDIPSYFEFNDGITLTSTGDLEILLSMHKLKMESTNLEPKDMELIEVVNV